MVKRSIEQEIRNKNFGARNGNYETNAVVKNQRVKQREQRILGDCWQWKANGQYSKGDNCSFRHDINKRAKSTQPNPSQRDLLRSRERKMHREPEVPEEEVPVEECLDGPARSTSKDLAPLHSVKSGILQCFFYKSEKGCRFGEKCSYAHRQVDEQPSKRSKKNGEKSAVARYMTIGCVFQDMEPPRLSSILRKSSNILKPIWCKAVVRHADIRDQNPSLGVICPGDPHQRNTNAPIFEDRSQEETEWQEQCAREAAWRLAKSILKLKEKKQHCSHLRKIGACLRHQFLKLEEREFVVHSGASMHMISKKDLSEAEMDTLTKSCSPTIVITANGEMQTHEEATVYVKELNIFLTMKVLEDTPAVPSLGKFCDENGYSYEWINGQKPHLIKNGFRKQCNTENFVPIVIPCLTTSSSSSSTSTLMTSSTEIDHWDHPPAIVSSESVDRQERRDPHSSETSEELLNKTTKNPRTK